MAGAGYKLFNTGDVLTAAQVNTYLMEQTVMVFADAAARTAALSGVVSEGMISYLKDTNAVEVYDGSNWVASDDPNAIQNTIVDAKGDLITATAADTPARLAVGNNGETLVADSSASTGLRWQEPKADNPVINSAFQVWQRGTSFSSDAGIYTADRWLIYRNVTSSTISRQATGDTTNLPNIQYCLRFQRNSGTTSTSTSYVSQSFETVNSIPFAGKTVTLSFYARCGANFSATSNQIQAKLATGTGTDQNVITGTYTGVVTAINQTTTLTTTWQRFTATATLSNALTELAIYFEWASTGTAGANDWVEITGVQLEVGSVATPFKTYAATLAGELAACQRYYWRGVPTQAYSVLSTGGFGTTSTTANIGFGLPVPLRVQPTSVDYSTIGLWDSTGAVIAITGVALNNTGNNTVNVSATVASGVTANRPYQILSNNSTSGYIGFSAEL